MSPKVISTEKELEDRVPGPGSANPTGVPLRFLPMLPVLGWVRVVAEAILIADLPVRAMNHKLRFVLLGYSASSLTRRF